MTRVTFLPSGQSLELKDGANLLGAAEKLGLPLRHVCGGNANCTTCRVRIEEGGRFLYAPGPRETARLPQERLEQGWRLACQACAAGGGQVVARIPTLVEWIRLTQNEVD